MSAEQLVSVSVSEFVDLLNQTYEFAFPGIVVTGELANFRVSKNKWVYFDLKDEEASVKCFGTVYQLPGPLEDGMLLQVRGTPHMHQAYGFSFSVQTIQPAGEGSLKRAAELLAGKLKAEGLFEAARKRTLPYPPERIGLITSAQSAAYADFIKVLGARWGGIEIRLVDVQVQGEVAPTQIIAAIERFNALAEPPQVLVLIRGGGSADDLAAFSHEGVVRTVAASRVPVLAAIGHEVDVSLAELAADARASTPSNAAELLVPDRRHALETVAEAGEQLYDAIQDYVYAEYEALRQTVIVMDNSMERRLGECRADIESSRRVLEVLNPRAALARGYAVIRKEREIIRRGKDLQKGDIISIELADDMVDAEVTEVRKK